MLLLVLGGVACLIIYDYVKEYHDTKAREKRMKTVINPLIAEEAHKFEQMARKHGKSHCERMVTYKEVKSIAVRIGDYVLNLPPYRRNVKPNVPTIKLGTNVLISHDGLKVDSDFDTSWAFLISFEEIGMADLIADNEAFGLAMALEMLIKDRINEINPHGTSNFTSNIKRVQCIYLDFDFEIKNPLYDGYVVNQAKLKKW